MYGFMLVTYGILLITILSGLLLDWWTKRMFAHATAMQKQMLKDLTEEEPEEPETDPDHIYRPTI